MSPIKVDSSWPGIIGHDKDDVWFLSCLRQQCQRQRAERHRKLFNHAFLLGFPKDYFVGVVLSGSTIGATATCDVGL